jgi:ribosome biogenesis protein MAK21
LPHHDSTMEQHIDALYRVVHTAPAAATTQALLLLFHLSVGAEFEQDQRQTISRKLRPEEHARRDRFYRALYSTLAQPSLLGTGKHLTMFFNLLYKAMKYDNDQTRVVAFAKRILCTTIHCSSSVVAGSLFLLNEITKHHGNLLSCFQDVLEGSDAFRVLDPTKREPRGALVLSEYVDAPEIASEENEQSIEKAITKAPLWELTLLLKHFHPSVSRFASAIGNIDYSGDPLRDFGVGPFLDKFAYRNPKSIDRVADDFFHKFFLEQARRDKLKGIVRHKPKVDAVEHLEEDAFDEAEVATLDVQKFDDLEQGWETDDEEEAYVDALAQKIIEDSINENGPADIDEEDPDMEGWGDMYSDEELEDESDDESESSQKCKALTRNDTIVGDGIKDLDSEENDVDAFMDIDGADSSVSDDDELFMDEQLVLMSADLDGLDSSDDHISDSGVDGNLTLINEEKSNDGEVVEEGASLNHTVEGLATFVDADEYEAMITKSWNEKKRSRKRIDGKSDHARATSPKRRM